MWRDHDPRSHDRSAREPMSTSGAIRAAGAAAARTLARPCRVHPRDVFTRGLALPRGSRRQRVSAAGAHVRAIRLGRSAAGDGRCVPRGASR